MPDSVTRSGREATYVWAITIVYAGVIAFLALHHEMWRDEVRALTIAIDSETLTQVFEERRNEGHPVLWYALLYFGYKLSGSVYVLPVFSALIAVAATALFLAQAPFGWKQKLLFPFGLLPLYEYSVMCRHYGIIMLLMFVACALFTSRFERPLSYAGVLFLLANASVHSLIIVIGFLGSYLWELSLLRTDFARGHGCFIRIAFAVSVIVVGIAVSLWQVIPDQGSIIPTVFSVLRTEGLGDVLRRLGNNTLRLGLLLLLSLFCALFWKAKPVFIIYLVGVLGLISFMALMYPGMLWAPSRREIGVVFLLITCLFWLDSRMCGAGRRRELDKYRQLAITVYLLTQVGLAILPTWRDVSGEMSSSRAFGAYLRQRPELKRAILVPEPDYLLEALPYYASNDIYLAREGRFGLRAAFTTASRQGYSLDELLTAATMLQSQTGRPVLLVLGHRLEADSVREIRYGYDKSFAYSKRAVDKLAERTVEVAEFRRARTDENFEVRLIQPWFGPS